MRRIDELHLDIPSAGSRTLRKPPRGISFFFSADVTSRQRRSLMRHSSSHVSAKVPLSVNFKGQSMDRRQFLRAVSILGSCGFSSANKSFASQTADSCTLEVEAASNPDAEHSPKVGIVAIGSTGNWILNRLNGTLPQLHRCISVEGGRLTIVKIDENNRVIRGGLWRNNRPAGWGGRGAYCRSNRSFDRGSGSALCPHRYE